MTQQFSDYQAPPAEPADQAVLSLESENGIIMLRPNRFGLGYKATIETEGLGAADVDNELTPRLGKQGAMLGTQHETHGEMTLGIVVNSTSPAEVRRLIQNLESVLKIADGTVRLIIDYLDGDVRFRDVVYKSGLSKPNWSTPYTAKLAVKVEYPDPWAYSTEDGQVSLSVTQPATGGLTFPMEFPVEFATSGGMSDQWGTNNGEQPSPMTLRFDGPVLDPGITLQGHWTFRVNGTLAYDEYLVIDPQDATATIYSTTSNHSRPAYTMIRTGSRFGDLIMPPGEHAFTFRAIDDTFTASVTASWPHTYRSMQ